MCWSSRIIKLYDYNIELLQSRIQQKQNSRKMFPVSVPRIFKIAGRVSVVKAPFGKIRGEISGLYKAAENSIACIDMFRKVVLLEILRNSLLTRVAVLQSNILQR